MTLNKIQNRMFSARVSVYRCNRYAVTAMENKLLYGIPTIKWEIQCNNEFCEKNDLKTTQSAKVISINTNGTNMDFENLI